MLSGLVQAAGGVIVEAAMAHKMQEAQTALMKSYVENLGNMPKWNAVCRYHAANVGSEPCENCCGTNREPIPTREVIQSGSY